MLASVVRILVFQARSLTYPGENGPDDEHRVERQTEVERPIHTKTSRFEAATHEHMSGTREMDTYN